MCAGHSHGWQPKGVLLSPQVTPQQEKSPAGGRGKGAAVPVGARIMSGRDPITFGWGQRHATEMTSLQPLSAVGFLRSPSTPLPASSPMGDAAGCWGSLVPP